MRLATQLQASNCLCNLATACLSVACICCWSDRPQENVGRTEKYSTLPINNRFGSVWWTELKNTLHCYTFACKEIIFAKMINLIKVQNWENNSPLCHTFACQEIIDAKVIDYIKVLRLERAKLQLDVMARTVKFNWYQYIMGCFLVLDFNSIGKMSIKEWKRTSIPARTRTHTHTFL